jgi:hypothetical protein
MSYFKDGELDTVLNRWTNVIYMVYDLGDPFVFGCGVDAILIYSSCWVFSSSDASEFGNRALSLQYKGGEA